VWETDGSGAGADYGDSAGYAGGGDGRGNGEKGDKEKPPHLEGAEGLEYVVFVEHVVNADSSFTVAHVNGFEFVNHLAQCLFRLHAELVFCDGSPAESVDEIVQITKHQ
jgi:hypothetical protein